MTESQTPAVNKNAPPFVAWHVRENENRKAKVKAFWTRIGVAWAHHDGKGYNVDIDVVPLDGHIVLRAPEAKTEE